MPPSGRSSGSHSSSSRSSSSRSSSKSSSSSHSSSSHSYSSSRSSGSSHSYSGHSSGSSYRSGPSGFSSGSHRPSSHSSSTHTRVSNGGVPIRSRVKQPSGYHNNMPGYQAPITYHCRNHDYVYYALGWRDAQTGTTYEPGYYDENGQYYDEVAIKDKSSGILTVKCEYCDSLVKTKWTDGEQPTCPNCGAVLKMDKADELLSSYKESYQAPVEKKKSKMGGKRYGILLTLMLFLLLGGIMDKEPAIIFLAAGILIVTSPFVSKFLSKGVRIAACVGIFGLSSFMNSVTSDSDSKIETVATDNSIYVETLGRTCKWYDEYNSYYDKQTDCYFAYNDDSEIWQYWYEGISSDYGDYGWMEYDETEKQWYIQVSSTSWSKLPSKYNTANLWYIPENSDQSTVTESDPYQDINSGSFYVETLGRSCDWEEEYGSYYDRETDCYFWYNTDVTPACWQYWYEGISSDFGDYGWMEFDEEEKQWYIEASEDNWIVLPKGYNADDLWHIEK